MGYLVCPLCCGRSFANRKSLKYHLLTSEKSIHCPECSQQFNTVVELADHLDLETCEQLAFVIHVNNTDPNGKLEAYGRGSGLLYKQSSGDKPSSKLSCHSVEKSQQNWSLTLPIKQNEGGKDETGPLDTSTNSRQDLSGALDISHDMDAIKKWEQEVPDEMTEHYCNSCNCNVYGIAQHINRFHPNETVILQDAEGEDTELIEYDVDNTVSDSYHPLQSDLNTQEGGATKSLGNTQTVNDYVAPHSNKEDNPRIPRGYELYADLESVSLDGITTKCVDDTVVNNCWSATAMDIVNDISRPRPTTAMGIVSDISRPRLNTAMSIVSDISRPRPTTAMGIVSGISRPKPTTAMGIVSDISRPKPTTAMDIASDISRPRPTTAIDIVSDISRTTPTTDINKVSDISKPTPTTTMDIVNDISSPTPTTSVSQSITSLPQPVDLLSIVKVLRTEKQFSMKDDDNITMHVVKRIIPTKSLKGKMKEPDVGSKEVQTKQRVTGKKKLSNESDVVSSQKKKKPIVKHDSADLSSVPPPVTKIPPKLKKPTLIQAHITQLLHSKDLAMLKHSLSESSSNIASNEDILQKLFTAANDYLGDSGSSKVLSSDKTPSSSPSKINEENRSIILKFESDISTPLSKTTIPIFECNLCNVEFTDPHNFAAHRCIIPKPVLPTLCELCGFKCKTHSELQLHLETHDPTTKTKKLFEKQVQKLLTEPATCDICKTEFTSARGLKAHQRMHRPDNLKKVAEMNQKVEYRCELCNDVCYSKRTLGIHRKIHLNNQQETVPRQQQPLGGLHSSRKLDLLTCKLCKESFSSNLDLKTHWQTHCSVLGVKLPDVTAEETVGQKEAAEQLFTCHLCGEELAESLRLAHEKTHTGEKPFVCKDCNHPFLTEMDLKFHMNAHSTKVELECVTCKTKFIDATLLKIHMKTHAGVDHPYPCGFCGRYFSRPHEKVKHERVHTGEKPYECTTCGMRFRVSYLLRVHERIHTGIRPYRCEHCGKTFRSGGNHMRHVRIHSNVRAYVCPYCPKQFKTGVQLASHKKSHTKPYSCPHCGRSFAAIYTLRAHINTHSKSALNYSCNICGASYGRSYALHDHLKTHGKDISDEDDGLELENENDLGVTN